MGYTRRNNNEVAAAAYVGCGFWLTIFITNILLGTWSVMFLSLQFIHTQIHWIGAALIGLLMGQFTVPIAIIVKLWLMFT